MRDLQLCSPLNGVYTPIEEVPDQVFAQKVLGDGFAINPTSNILKSPCAGTIVQLHKSHHAITIETSNREQILLHIGLNTVSLRGEGFSPLVKVGDKVSQGQSLIEFDLDFIALQGLDLTTILVCLNEEDNNSLTILNTDVIVEEASLIASLKTNSNNTNLSSNKESKEFISIDYNVALPSGMHARPAARIVKLAKGLNSTLKIIKGEDSASALSVVGILGLGIEKNDTIKISANGEIAKLALDQVKELLDTITKEEISSHRDERPLVADTKKIKKNQKDALYGVSASSGIAIGNIVISRQEKLEFLEESKDKDLEKKRLLDSLKSASSELTALENKLISQGDTSKAAIFSAHKEIIDDAELIDECLVLISSWKTAEFAWDSIISKRALKLEALKNELIAARANDLRDVGNRVLMILTGKTQNEDELLSDSIIIANDLTPSDIIQFDTDKVIGFATVCGGTTSHVAILARSMGIPAIAGIDEKVLELKDGQTVIMDANDGILFTRPNQEQLTDAKNSQKAYQEKLDLALKSSMETTYTSDKQRIKVVSNISGVSDAKKSTELGAEGVGLLRTEFIFLERKDAPSEDEQFEIYQNIVNSLNGNELVLRTLDIGGDKQLSYLPIKEEENPFLGVRGIRFCLRNEGIFREQLRAVLRVKSEEPINVMFPMVGHLDELFKAKEILEDERVKLNAPKPHVGIMIEVPSAALMADLFAPHVDFFSVGTNDLTQYTLATDRGHNELAAQVDGLNPAVLKLIAITCEAAKKYGKWVGVCGGIASEIKAIPVLLALGVEELSVSMPSIPIVKSTVRLLDKSECETMTNSFLSARTGQEVRDIVTAKWPSL